MNKLTIEKLKELKNKNPKKFIEKIISLHITREGNSDILKYVDNEVEIERNSTLNNSLLYNNIEKLRLLLNPEAQVDYEFAKNIRSSISDGFIKGILKLKDFSYYCPLELRIAFEKTSESEFRKRRTEERIVNYYIGELGRLPVEKYSKTNSSITKEEKEAFLEETRTASNLQKFKLYLTNETIRNFCINTFVSYYLTDDEQLDIFKKFVKENGWPKQDQGKLENHTLSHRLYHWAKRLLTKTDPEIVKKRYPGFLEFAEKYHTRKRSVVKRSSNSWAQRFSDWCSKYNDYPRPKYIFGNNKIPEAAVMSQILVIAYNQETKATIRLSLEEAEIIRKVAESYGYKYISGGLRGGLIEKKQNMIYFENYVLWVKNNKRLPNIAVFDEEEQFYAYYLEEHKNEEKMVQFNTIVKYAEISEKAKELLEAY